VAHVPLLARAVGVARSFGGVLFPRECAACPSPAGQDSAFCASCGEPIAYPDEQLGGVRLASAGRYAPPLSTAIARIKFEERADLIAPLAWLLLPALKDLAPRPSDAFVPVPLHRARLVERGYNQSALLARALARASGASFAPRVLARTRRTEQQARLGREARQDNVAQAFAVQRAWTRGRVILIDDVVTTGATALACIEALRAVGTEPAMVLALSRAG
jgi:ComF family protein